MPAVPRRGRPPRHNRADILDAASGALIFRGYDGLRYGDIAHASGVPVASLQHYFPTIEVLRREATRHTVRTELDAVVREMNGIADPWARLRHLIFEAVSGDPATRRGTWVIWLEYWRAAAHDPALAGDSRALNERWLALIGGCIAEGVEAGQFSLEGTPRAAAAELLATLDGLGIRLAAEHTPEEAAEAVELLDRAARRMLRPVTDPGSPA